MYIATLDCDLLSTERTILQLKFGPLPHCSNWYKEKVRSKGEQC